MGTYLSYEEFISYDTGVSIPEGEYGQIAQAADIVINGLMSTGENLKDPPEDVLKAVAFQTAYIYENGGVMALGEPGVAAERIGSYQWSASKQRGDGSFSGNSLHPLVLTLLLRTGKLHRGGRYAQ
ncbi:MAG: hypothetical protein ACOX8S_01775 [Christensenellales bacterium]|jgi:hypothetical protein